MVWFTCTLAIAPESNRSNDNAGRVKLEARFGRHHRRDTTDLGAEQIAQQVVAVDADVVHSAVAGRARMVRQPFSSVRPAPISRCAVTT